MEEIINWLFGGSIHRPSDASTLSAIAAEFAPAKYPKSDKLRDDNRGLLDSDCIRIGAIL